MRQALILVPAVIMLLFLLNRMMSRCVSSAVLPVISTDWLTGWFEPASTGVYRIPVYEIPEERGLSVLLVNARHVKNVPGRKSDVQDCQWLQQLHTCGLLRGGFRTDEEGIPLRAYLRQRSTLIERSADHIRHIQKALRQMNLLPDNVVSDVTGKTGLLIIRAIIAGERDPSVLAQHRQRHCRKDEMTIAASSEGNYRDEHLFALQQAVEFYDFYQQQIAACDRRIEAQLKQKSGKADPSELPDLPEAKSKHPLTFDVRSELYRLTGVDLTRIDGMNESSVLKVLAETGTDMEHWPTEKHFASWLGLCPGNKVTGGKILNSNTKPCANRAAATFRLCAFSLFNSNSAPGGLLSTTTHPVGCAQSDYCYGS